MGYIANQIRQAATELGTDFIELGEDESSRIHEAAWDRFAVSRIESLRGAFLWENLGERISVRDPQGWRLVDDLLAGLAGQQIYLFDDRAEPIVFAFPQGTPLVPVLGETSNFEFYLTNDTFDYLICHNHHDFLIAVGTAMPVLKALSS